MMNFPKFTCGNDPYDPPVHKHRWAKNDKSSIYSILSAFQVNYYEKNETHHTKTGLKIFVIVILKEAKASFSMTSTIIYNLRRQQSTII